jgi:hypothetical protein
MVNLYHRELIKGQPFQFLFNCHNLTNDCICPFISFRYNDERGEVSEMKIKVVMESGNEYYSEKDINVEALAQRILAKPNTINMITLDQEEKIIVNASKISEIIIED